MNEKRYYTALEVGKMIGVGRTSAYSIVKKLNKELSDKGYLVVDGKISKDYFESMQVFTIICVLYVKSLALLMTIENLIIFLKR